MKNVFDASNSVEAYMIANLLEQCGIDSRVDGEYLQGGMGELPVSGLVRVLVADVDYNQARSVIIKWDSHQSSLANEKNSDTTHKEHDFLNAVGSFIAGLVIGGMIVFWLLNTPAT